MANYFQQVATECVCVCVCVYTIDQVTLWLLMVRCYECALLMYTRLLPVYVRTKENSIYSSIDCESNRFNQSPMTDKDTTS